MAENAPGKKYPPEVIAEIATYLALPENKFPSGMVVKQIQVDNIKDTILPLIQTRTYPTWDSLFQDVKAKLDEKNLRNIEKYRVMMPYLFKDFLK
jgi:hypothetical protein